MFLYPAVSIQFALFEIFPVQLFLMSPLVLFNGYLNCQVLTFPSLNRVNLMNYLKNNLMLHLKDLHRLSQTKF